MKSPKGTILFLSYYFPPLKAIACMRTWALTKYLSRCGWRMRVVTPRADFWDEQDPEPLQQPDAKSLDCIRTGYYWPCLSSDTKASRKNLLGKIGRHIGWRLRARYGFEPMKGWIYAAERALRRLEPGSTDVVMASGPPFSSFPLARALAHRLKCQFVLDYRDLWTSDPHTPLLKTKRNRSLEIELLKQAAAVTTVSPHAARVLQATCADGKVHVVTNGYDRERMSGVVPQVFAEPAIVYAGRLYPPVRTLEPIMLAIAAIRRLTPKSDILFRLHYFGPDGASVSEQARQIGVSPWVTDRGNVSQQAALAEVAGAHVVAVVTSTQDRADDAELGIVTGKVFEALGLGKRLLVVAPEGSDVEEIIGRNGGRFSGSQVAEIANFLLESTRSPTPPAEAPPEEYSWEGLASVYDRLLSDVTSRKSSPGAGSSAL